MFHTLSISNGNIEQTLTLLHVEVSYMRGKKIRKIMRNGEFWLLEYNYWVNVSFRNHFLHDFMQTLESIPVTMNGAERGRERVR